MKNKKFFSYAIAYPITLLALTGCLSQSDSSSGSGTTTTTTTGGGNNGGGNSGGGGSGGGSPSYGLSCFGNANGYDPLVTDNDPSGDNESPYIIVPSTSGLTGNYVNSVSMSMYLADNSGNAFTGGTSYSVSVTMDAYQCVSPSGSLPSSAGTATMGSSSLSGTATTETFTFSQPVSIPTNCSAGEYPLVFKVVYTPGYNIWAASGAPNSGTSCYTPESTNGLSAETRSWSLDITGSE